MSKSKILSKSESGNLFVISSPSGAGKTTLVEEFIRRDSNAYKTISHTTRKPRDGERNGRDYYFVDQNTFEKMIQKKAFVEWAKVYGHHYGTSRKTIEAGLRKGKDVFLVIEAKGARAIRRLYGARSKFILILPPSLHELKKRIFGRGGMSQVELKDRIAKAQKEVEGMQWYDYVIINDRLETALLHLTEVVHAERRRPIHAVKTLSKLLPKS